MLFATKEKEQQLVSVFLAILEIHSCLVDQNVLKTQIVQETKFVGIKSVLIPAQDCVVSMLFALFQTMFQDVIVYKVTLVTPQCLATSVSFLFI